MREQTGSADGQGADVVGYRLYFLNGQGRIQSALELECESDAQAVRAAEGQGYGGPMELWSLARIVAKFAASRPAPEAFAPRAARLPHHAAAH